jgi:hypothetical protein
MSRRNIAMLLSFEVDIPIRMFNGLVFDYKQATIWLKRTLLTFRPFIL